MTKQRIDTGPYTAIYKLMTSPTRVFYELLFEVRHKQRSRCLANDQEQLVASFKEVTNMLGFFYYDLLVRTDKQVPGRFRRIPKTV
jgi:hypothetical protein